VTCELRDYVAAYVLAALEPDEAALVQEHLPTCEACQNELTNLGWIPQLLPLVPVQELERFDDALEAPPPALLERLVRAASREVGTPRGRRATALLGAAALLAAVGTLSTVAGPPHHGTRSQTSTVAALDPRTHVSATVEVAPHDWGTQLNLDLKGAYPNGTCWLVAHADDGRTDTAATWVATPQGSASVPGATAIPADHLTELDVVAANGHQLVRIVLPNKEDH
jgi:hypothetical protein